MMLRRFRRWLARHISVDTLPLKRAGAVLTFYDDGSSETVVSRGFLLTSAQNAALQEFIAEQMGETLEQFERERVRVRMMDELATALPVSREVN
jgi:hypothetical protein